MHHNIVMSLQKTKSDVFTFGISICAASSEGMQSVEFGRFCPFVVASFVQFETILHCICVPVWYCNSICCAFCVQEGTVLISGGPSSIDGHS